MQENKPSPLYQIVIPKQARILTPDSLLYSNKIRSKEKPILRHPQTTNPIIWFCAILCMVFSLLLIFFAIATLIIYVVVKPRNPVLDTPAANFNSPEFLNGDLTFLANFSNPNRILNVRYEYLYFELYFSESLIATQVVQPFSQKPGEARLVSIHLMSRLVYLPPNLALEFQKQEERNRVMYNIKGRFRVRVKLGSVHYSYWLHGKCEIEMTSPPTGILIAHNCRTKR
ncbi:hypothetical protein ACJIZ3_007061 [Penstemon smallii]|uniref:Late embryogenesis abundant protein LEA-2 subgroup domain-containing protein n=1 Tax=Penstemon smallii TaxID=265156 RepID=A0ABD3S9R6_9LAMI